MNKKLVIVFIDFDKAHNSTDRQTFFNILDDFDIDYKTLSLTKQTVIEKKSEIKFQGEKSEFWS